MKAILMNSADKLQDTGDGLLLGMEKTILRKDGLSTWLTSDARDSDDNPGGRAIPLDKEMGTGQLNVHRALIQYKPGSFSAVNPIPAIGWSLKTFRPAFDGQFVKYKFDQPLRGGSYVSATLTWDRMVTLNDRLRNGLRNGSYDAGETFTGTYPTNLDLYLVRKGAPNFANSVWSSTSIIQNVEHIFFKLPAADGEYELWVRRQDRPGIPPPNVDYALAWWAVEAPDAGEAAVRGRLWQDTSTLGIQESGERDLAGVVASLYTAGGSFVAQATTDVYGGYQFTSLAAGDYYVSIAGVSGYSFSPQDQGNDDTIDSDVNSSGQKSFTVTATSDLTFDAGLVPSATGVVSGRAFLDLAHDGVDGAGDAPAPGLAVSLFTGDGEQVAATTTDPAGYYAFSGVGPGGYRVGFASTSGYTFTDKDAGSDDTIDSDAYSSGVTDEFTLLLGQNRNDVGAGLVQTASVGDRVWVDANDNGVQDVGELALPYAQVELYTAAGDLVATTLSDSDGYYGFAGLVPGQYYLRFTAPSGYRLAYQDQGYDDTADSDPDSQGRTADFTLAPGDAVSTWDAGMVPVPASGTVGDRVWEDTDGDGRQGFTEPGVAGVEVRLLSAASGSVLATTTTNADGLYQFTQVVPGDYKVEFVKPTGRTFTTSSPDEDPRLDSDADPSTGRTAVFTLALGEANLDLDAGLLSSTVQYGSAGDRLWLDADRDGLQGPSEAGLAGAAVYLLDGQGHWLRTTETGPGGAYSFINLPPGDYFVQFAQPEGHKFTKRDQGGNDALDSDANPGSGRTAKFTLAGAALSSLDAGVYVVPPAPTVNGVSPDQGTTSGGLSVIISGTNFTYVDQVYFGTVLAASFTVNSPGQITAKTPAHQAGTFDVTVVTAGGTSNAGRFTFVAAPAPSVTSLDVRSGPTYGGTVVAISGTHFLGATQVKFGDTAASFQISSDTLILATSPAHAAGLVHVTVVTPSGTSEQTSADGFTYVPPPPPAVAGLNPGSGPGRGGTVVTIHGSNFTGATAVQFGTSHATGVRVLNGSTLVATSPAHAVGVVYVKVVTPGGTSAAVEAGRFTYTANPPLVTGVTPATDTESGGRVVTITGADFPTDFTSGGSTVKFGDVVVGREGILGASRTAITVYAPPHAVGLVHVTVATPQGASATSSASLFEYTQALAPSVTSVSPASGYNIGNEDVIITGSHLLGVTQVLFGDVGVAVTRANVSDDGTQIFVRTPRHAAGRYPVQAVSPGGTSAQTASTWYTFVVAPLPAVSSIAPASGTTGGGTRVVIRGSHFNNVELVWFGPRPAASFTVDSPTQITAFTNPWTAGSVYARVKTAAGWSSIGPPGRYTYVAAPPPAIGNVTPRNGPTSGGTVVTITGTNFLGAHAVLFGGVLLREFTVLSPTRIRVAAPPHAAGPVHVVVRTYTGQSASTNADLFTYVAPAPPAITKVTPDRGPTGGGNIVVIQGSGFSGATAVRFGTRAATWFEVVSPNSIKAMVPPAPVGVVDVRVTTGAGQSAIVFADRYTYFAGPPVYDEPVVGGLNYGTGAAGGGRLVIITGTGFTGATGVTFGTAAASYAIDSDTQISAVVPAGTAGAVDVLVTTDNGTSPATAASQFTYLSTPAPAVTSLGVASGTTAGGTDVVITGTDFTGATEVRFGGILASFTIDSPTQITAVGPPDYPGTVDVAVTTPSGTSAASAGSAFTYAAAPAPAVTALGTTSGTTAGGTSVVITGTDFGGVKEVLFDGVPAASFTLDSPTQITAVSPAWFAATIDVVVVTTAGGSDPTAAQFTFTPAPPPAVASLGTATGTTAGGTSVTITGSGFTGARAVRFGDLDAASFTVVSDTQVTAVAPPRVAGAVNVTVVTHTGNSAGSSSSQFTYTAALTPVVTSLATTGGTSTSFTAATAVASLTMTGSTVVITGTNFTATTAVLFGDVPAASFTVDSATQITAVSPWLEAGTVDVVVTTTAGSSATTLATALMIMNSGLVPEVFGAGPSSGSAAGGTVVAVTGSGFTGASGVTFGGVPAAWFEVISDEAILAVAPAGAAGAVDVAITFPDSTLTATGTDLFTYVAVSAPTITSLSAASGSTAGGDVITLTGTNLLDATGVTINGRAAEFVVLSETSVLVTTPAMPAGAFDVVVSVPGADSAPARFAYVAAAAPAVTGLGTTTGSTAGGTAVTISGTGFLGASSVLFGGTPVAFTVLSNTSIEAVAPSAAVAGAVDVVVYTPTGSSERTSSCVFTYTAAPMPTLTSLSLTAGSTVGDVTVNLTGTGFTAATSVKFGAEYASFTVMSDTWIAASAPAQAAGTVSVTVTTAGGTSSGQTFTYSAPAAPAVTGLTPATGQATGGDTVVVLGSGFTAATAVKFGTADAWSFQVLSDTALVATAPAGAAGTVDVTVTTAGGTSPVVSAGQYTYASVSAPTVTGLGATAGSSAGGATVLITGTSLGGATEVLFGGFPAAFVVNSDTLITAVAPSQAAGTVNVTVTTGAGTSATSSSDEFTYAAAAAPAVTRVGPSAGPLAGGNWVLLRGSNFLGATSVAFGAEYSPSFTVLSDTELFAAAPAGSAGSVHVTVTTPSGTSSTGPADLYAYQAAPTITAVSPGGDKASGGTVVTITGTNLLGTTAVYFGGVAGTGIMVVSSTTVKVTVPTHAAGAVDVVVVAPGGFSGSLSFTYSAESDVTWVGPTGGPPYSYSWSTGANWDTGVAPGSNDDVLILTGAVTLSGGSVTAHRVVVEGTLQLTLGASLTVTGGVELRGGGTLVVDASSSLSADSYAQTGGTATFEGDLTVEGAVYLSGGDLTADGGGVTLDVGAIVQTGGDLTIDSATLLVAGDFLVQGGATLLTGGNATVSGEVVVTGGTLTLSDVGTVAVTGGVEIDAGGTLVLAVGGTLAADVTNAGTVSLGSRTSPTGGDAFVIDGDYTQAALAVLAMDADYGGHDSLTVTGTATLGGTFRLELLDGYEPTSPDSFALLSYGSRVGTFETLELPELSWADWDARYDDPLHDDAFSLWAV